MVLVISGMARQAVNFEFTACQEYGSFVNSVCIYHATYVNSHINIYKLYIHMTLYSIVHEINLIVLSI